MKKFVLIDGNAIVHRAYHALPNFTTAKGEPVGAVFGFVSMLLKVIGDLKPTYIAVAFDMEAPTFRQQLYVGYQANRPSMGEDLSPQFDEVKKVLEALNIPIFGVEGYEADDVIGTIAERSVKRKAKNAKDQLEVIILSGDRDLLQLVNSHVKVYMPIKGLSEAKMFGSKEVLEKYGLHPHQVVDMKSLMGDASDNYPGVTGIGPKGASTLLQKYHTLEEIYKHVSELPERQQKALAECAEACALAKKLAQIVTDVPLQFKVEECRFKVENVEKAVEVLRSFEFRTLTNRFLELMGRKPMELTSTIKSASKPKSDQLRLV